MRYAPYFFLLFINFFSLSSYSNNSNGSASSENTKEVLCPAPEALIKDSATNTWSYDNHHFQSHDISFAQHVVSFIGAQWVGSNLGQITCVYKASPSTAFPILLVYDILAVSPSYHNWTADLGGYKNCHADHQTNCVFSVRKKTKSENIWNIVRNLKMEKNKNYE